MMKQLFKRAGSILLALTMLLGCLLLPIYAEGETATTKPKSKWDLGDASSMSSLTFNDEAFKYAYYNKYTNYTYQQDEGAYPMVSGMTDMGVAGLIPGEMLKIVENQEPTPTQVKNVRVRFRSPDKEPHGAYFSHDPSQNNISPCIAFTANQTGTVRFTVQTFFRDTTSKVVVGSTDTMTYKGSNNYNDASFVKTAPATQATAVEEWTVEVDVKKGSQVLFIMELAAGTGTESLLHVKSAEYIMGDLNAQPVTFVTAQATDKDTTTNTFDVRLASAVCPKLTEQTTEIGYRFTLRIGGTVRVENKEVLLDTVYKTLEAYADGSKIAELKSAQGTYWMAGIIKGLPADQKVEIELTAFAGDETDTPVLITYENGTCTIVNLTQGEA